MKSVHFHSFCDFSCLFVAQTKPTIERNLSEALHCDRRRWRSKDLGQKKCETLNRVVMRAVVVASVVRRGFCALQCGLVVPANSPDSNREFKQPLPPLKKQPQHPLRLQNSPPVSPYPYTQVCLR